MAKGGGVRTSLATMDDPNAVETGAEPVGADLRQHRLDPLADR
jgi:hypothetical protein